jgi:hypothetical protein
MKAPRKLKKRVKLYLKAKEEKREGLKVKITLIDFDLQKETYTWNCRTFLNKKIKTKQI